MLESATNGKVTRSVFERDDMDEAQGLDADVFYQDECEVIEDDEEHQSVEHSIGESVKRESLLNRLTDERVTPKGSKRNDTNAITANLAKNFPQKRSHIRNKR